MQWAAVERAMFTLLHPENHSGFTLQWTRNIKTRFKKIKEKVHNRLRHQNWSKNSRIFHTWPLSWTMPNKNYNSSPLEPNHILYCMMHRCEWKKRKFWTTALKRATKSMQHINGETSDSANDKLSHRDKLLIQHEKRHIIHRRAETDDNTTTMCHVLYTHSWRSTQCDPSHGMPGSPD